MQPPVPFIDRIYRFVVANAFGIDHLGNLIVQNKRLAIEVDDQHRVRDFQVQIVQHHDAHVFDGQAQIAQRNVFGDRIVLAIAIAVEKLLRRCPVIPQSVIYRIDDLPVGTDPDN